MKIKVTEHKSVGTLNTVESLVRVFVDQDYDYGYFVPERALFELLSREQREEYLRSDTADLEVSIEVAEKIIEMGHTPYAKRKLR